MFLPKIQTNIRYNILLYNIVSMETNTTSNNVWVCKFRKRPLSKKCNYQSHMDICKVYKDHFKANCIDECFER